MSQSKLKALFNHVPGFKDDKDEEWAFYLPAPDQMAIRKGRENFVIMKDELDELKLKLKDNIGDSPEHRRISSNIKSQIKKIDNYVDTLLQRIPTLKDTAIKAREKAIEDDMNLACSGGNTGEETDYEDDYHAFAGSFDVFLPSFMTSTETTNQDTSGGGPAASTSDQDSPVQEKINTYLDGVEEQNVEIMQRLKPYVTKYDCKRDTLEALRRFRERDDRLMALKKFQSFETNKNNVVSRVGGRDAQK